MYDHSHMKHQLMTSYTSLLALLKQIPSKLISSSQAGLFPRDLNGKLDFGLWLPKFLTADIGSKKTRPFSCRPTFAWVRLIASVFGLRKGRWKGLLEWAVRCRLISAPARIPFTIKSDSRQCR